MKKQRSPKVRLISSRCPKCGSNDVCIDLLAVGNLKKLPLTVLTSSIIPGGGTSVHLRCEKCNAKYLG
jgi:hypothetical protein